MFDFENPETHKKELKNHEFFFCCIGTTRALAGSAEAFVKIDKDYVVNAAKIYHEVNSNPPSPMHFLVVTSSNSDARSMFLYPKTKGQLEAELKKFHFKRLSIFQPGFLKGRPNDGRTLEIVASSVIKRIDFTQTMTVECEDVAKAMVKISRIGQEGVRYYKNREINEIAKTF